MTHHEHDPDRAHDHGHAPGHERGLLPHGDHADDAVLAELLDLDADALSASWAGIHATVAAAVGTPPATVVDLGAGTGTGTLALARLFPTATVVAVDVDPAMPGRVTAAAAAAGVDAGRLRPVVVDLDRGWPDLGPVDLVWASMALHHLGDVDRTLGELAGAIVPGGVLVAVEFDAPLRVLTAGAAGGLEDRAYAALDDVHRREVPELGAAWAARFAAAGFTVERDDTVDIDIRPPLADAAVRYAQLWLQRLAQGVGDRLDPGDVTALTRLGTPAGIADAVARGDVHLHGHRTMTVARRPRRP